MRLTAIVLCSLLPLAAQTDPREIVRKAMSHDKTNSERARNYTWTQVTTEKELNPSGKLEKTRTKTEELLIVGGEPFRRVISRDGKPLSGDELRKEDDRQRKAAADRAKVTEAERAKRRERERKFMDEVAEAYNFRFLPDQVVDGRPAWVIAGTPRKEYKPKAPRADLLQKFEGKLWIDKQECFPVRIEAISIEPVSFGLFLAKLQQGAKIIYEMTRVNDEVWLPKHMNLGIDARVLAFRKRIEVEQSNSNFKKFQVDSTIQTIAEK